MSKNFDKWKNIEIIIQKKYFLLIYNLSTQVYCLRCWHMCVNIIEIINIELLL